MSLKISKKIIIQILMLFVVLTNLLELLHINYLYLFSAVYFLNYLIIPGVLILTMTKTRLSFWEGLLYCIGLSIGFLEFGGLLINSLGFLNFLDIKTPLSFK